MPAYGISLPFKFNSLGKVDPVVESRDLWRHRVYLVVLTRFGERLMRPDFGTDLSTTLFEGESLASEIATRTIGIAFNTWLPGLKLIEVVPKYDKESGLLDVTVRYTLPSGTADEVIVNTGSFSRSGDLIKE